MPNVGVFGAVFVTATALLVSASSVEAQRLAVGYSVFLNPTTLEVVNLGTGLVESREQKSFSGPALFSSDGRFVVLSVFSPTSPSLEVRDLVTGFRTLIQTPLRPLRAHPRRLAVYGLVAGVVTRLAPTGLRPYDACGGHRHQLWHLQWTVHALWSCAVQGLSNRSMNRPAPGSVRLALALRHPSASLSILTARERWSFEVRLRLPSSCSTTSRAELKSPLRRCQEAHHRPRSADREPAASGAPYPAGMPLSSRARGRSIRDLVLR